MAITEAPTDVVNDEEINASATCVDATAESQALADRRELSPPRMIKRRTTAPKPKKKTATPTVVEPKPKRLQKPPAKKIAGIAPLYDVDAPPSSDGDRSPISSLHSSELRLLGLGVATSSSDSSTVSSNS